MLALVTVTYLVPALAALTGRHRAAGVAGYAAGVASRLLTARATGGRALPDALAHPVSVAGLAALTVESLHRRRRGLVAWKGRQIP